MIRYNDKYIKVFADGANPEKMIEQNDDPLIDGFTSNPTLLRKAGITDYEAFAKYVLMHITKKPISFEVIADTYDEMKRQACKIASWADNCYIKIPITNTQGITSIPLIFDLGHNEGIKINVTAVTTYKQVKLASEVLKYCSPSVISIFAGRIADTLSNPVKLMESARLTVGFGTSELLWASAREVYNVRQAIESGADIITLTDDLIKKLGLIGKNLEDYSLDTVKMFFQDALESGYEL